ncbi:site-specific integrase [Azospirillum sp. B506]|uniref:site-specific integrase n=1 Tax=Azospirillum sp. B506 TaxID=137721 RepID=UPI001FCA6AB0|nr:site-specific integrase [Azospirillum sp. B506]
MPNAFLRLRAGRYLFRRRIPDELVARFRQRELVRVLGPLTKAAALRQARRLAVVADQLFAMVKNDPTLSPEQIASLARQWFTQALAEFEREAAAHRFDDPEDLERAAQRARDRAEGAADLLRRNDIGVASGSAVALLAQHGVDASPESPTVMELARALLRAAAEAARLGVARLEGDYSARPVDPLFASAETPPAPAPTPAPAPAAQRKNDQTFAKAFERYSLEKRAAGAWRPAMDIDAQATASIFMEIAGDRPLSQYTRADIGEFVSALQRLPAHRTKRPRFKGKSVVELVALADADPSIERISPVTVKKYATILSAFWGWTVDRGLTDQNIARAAYKKPKRTIRRNQERDAWSVEQLRTLFNAPIWRGSKGATRRTEPGPQIIRDVDWWLPVLGLFHPCRLEELAQLRIADIREEGGIAYLDIHASDDDVDEDTPARRLKSAAAVRRVPIHKTVLALGFMDLVAERRAAGIKMLWPELKPGGAADRLSFDYSKRFGRLRRQLGIEGPDFHSFRHTAITALVRAEVHPDIVSQLSGHEIPGERGRYSKGAELAQLRQAIDSIAYEGIDAEFIGSRRGIPDVNPTDSENA